jgi:CDP-diacylglycerol--glycerol-3-phosphate 3-phosphatidyltransferase/cardiolipin synthase
MKLKIPNILTIGRIIIVPIFVLTFFIPGFFGDLIPFFLFVIASFTDYLDGLLARLFKEESKLGELLDPIADKILVAAALILLVMNGTIKNYEVIACYNNLNQRNINIRTKRISCQRKHNYASHKFI